MDCPICCYSFTDVARKPITCMCKFSACTKCVKTYLLGTYKDPHCMKCNIAWSREFIDNALSKAFRTGELKKHRENILVDREKSMLPATMPLVEEELEKRKIRKEIKEFEKEKSDLLKQIVEIDKKIHDKNVVFYDRTRRVGNTSTVVFQRPCPENKCRGFLSNWKCSLCGVKVCSKCHVIVSKDENDDGECTCEKDKKPKHVCKEDDVATAKLLEKDTRNCPNEACRAPIFKISGCSQMFCTKCHTAFDWHTGMIVNNQSAIHNPHYYEYMRQQNGGVIPRNIGDVPCGGMPTLYAVLNRLRASKISGSVQDAVMVYHRGVQHIIHYEIPRHPINLVGGDTFSQLRVRYLLNEISEADWKVELQRIEKKNERHIAYRHVFDMLVTVSVDMFNRIMLAKNDHNVNSILKEAKALKEYFNETIKKVSDRFSSNVKTCKQLDSRWNYISTPIDAINREEPLQGNVPIL